MDSQSQDPGSLNEARLWNEKEAAQYLGISVGFLQVDRARGAPRVPFIRIGRRCLYDRTDLDLFKRSCRITA